MKAFKVYVVTEDDNEKGQHGDNHPAVIHPEALIDHSPVVDPRSPGELWDNPSPHPAGCQNLHAGHPFRVRLADL